MINEMLKAVVVKAWELSGSCSVRACGEICEGVGS